MRQMLLYPLLVSSVCFFLTNACSSDSSSPASDASVDSQASDTAASDTEVIEAATDSAVDTSPVDAAASGLVQWKDEGTQNSASVSAEPLVPAGSQVGFAINTADPNTLNVISLNVFNTTAADWKAGTFNCPTNASISYNVKGTAYAMQSCSFTITDVGAVGGGNLKGTFSAVVKSVAGATKTISDGTIDVPYKKK